MKGIGPKGLAILAACAPYASASASIFGYGARPGRNWLPCFLSNDLVEWVAFDSAVKTVRVTEKGKRLTGVTS